MFGEFEIWFVLYIKLKLSPLVTSLVGSLLQYNLYTVLLIFSVLLVTLGPSFRFHIESVQLKRVKKQCLAACNHCTMSHKTVHCKHNKMVY